MMSALNNIRHRRSDMYFPPGSLERRMLDDIDSLLAWTGWARTVMQRIIEKQDWADKTTLGLNQDEFRVALYGAREWLEKEKGL